MSFSQAEILLGKIIALHKSMRLDDEAVSTIERDLMLDHLRKLYDIYLNISVEKGKKPAMVSLKLKFKDTLGLSAPKIFVKKDITKNVIKINATIP